MKKLVSTIVFLILVNTCLISQVSIDFCPKALLNELKKTTGSNEIEMKEFSFNEKQNSGLRLGKFFSLPASCAAMGVKYVYVGRVNTCRAGGCSLIAVDNIDQTKEFFDYFILYSDNATVRKVKIYNYQSTHGQEVTATSWLKQFGNYDGRDELVVGKNVDAISGATISADATSFDIESKTKLLHEILKTWGVLAVE